MHRPNHRPLILSLLALVALGCGASQAPEPQSPQPIVERPTPKPIRAAELPSATLPDGFEVTLEMAESQDEITQGLMFRSSLAENRGMLFVFHADRVPSFWMKNTLIPLDIIFLDPQGVVVDIAFDARPCKSEPCPQYVPKSASQAVLEVGSGVAAVHGVAIGARIGFQRVKGYPVENSPSDGQE